MISHPPSGQLSSSPHFHVSSPFLSVIYFLAAVALSLFPPSAFTPSYLLLSPFLSLTLSSCLFLSLYSQGRPWPHSFISLQDSGSTLSDYSTCSALSNIPSLCLSTTFTSTPPPLLFYPLSLSLALLPLLSDSNLSPEGSDWQASGGLVKGSLWLVVREMKRIKPPGPALTALQKNTHCNLSCAQSEGAFTSSMFEVCEVHGVYRCSLYRWERCHPKLR